jgi:6-phosphogluconolactonase
VQLVPSLPNPCFLAFDRTKRFLYSVHADREEISSFEIEAATGRLTPLNHQSTKG